MSLFSNFFEKKGVAQENVNMINDNGNNINNYREDHNSKLVNNSIPKKSHKGDTFQDGNSYDKKNTSENAYKNMVFEDRNPNKFTEHDIAKKSPKLLSRNISDKNISNFSQSEENLYTNNIPIQREY